MSGIAASGAGRTAGRLVIALVLAALALQAPAARAQDVVIGVPRSSSADATAFLLKRLLETQFHLHVRIAPATSEDIFAGMDSGTKHIHPEVWLPNHGALTDEYVLRRKSVVMSPSGVPVRQGLCVTEETREAHGIASVTDLLDPEKAKVFDTDGNGLGEIWIGAPDWPSTRIERIRARSYGYDRTMDLVEIEEEVALPAIDAAMAVGKPLVFYCYEPHYKFELHGVVFLDEPPYDPRKWKIVDPEKDPDWLAKSQAAVAWPPSFLHIDYARSLAESRPEVAAFLEAIRLDVDTISAMTYSLIVESEDPDAFADGWIKANRDRVARWRANSQK
jgi:glycine betaine/proline transport system substrate-binding protein